MLDRLLAILGWRLLLITGDPCVLDRWRWLRRRLRTGAVRTFDAGSGNGGFSIGAASLGNHVVSASFSADEQHGAQARAQRLGVTRAEFRIIDLREIEQHRAGLGSFDQVVCLEVIEHVLDDEALVRSLAAMLAPGGQLLLSTPFAGHHPLYTEELQPEPVEDGSHVRYGYTPERVAELATQAGLEVVEQDFISGVIAQKLTDLMRLLTERLGLTAAWLVLLPLRPLVVLDRPLTALLGYPHLSVALWAAKPAGAAPGA